MTPAEMAQADQILAHVAEHVSWLVDTAREMRDETVAVMCISALDADVTRDRLALALAVAVVRLAQQEVGT